MADGPSKTDIDAIFKRLRSSPANKQCFDCQANNPTWASVTYGVFLCIDCSAVHRSLGVHLTFIRSTQLDTSWTWMQLRAMQVGGNSNAIAYFRQHGCTTTDAQQKYNSRAATMYRDKLRALANKAMQSYGTKVSAKLHVDSAQEEVASPSAHEKEVDFFKEHQEAKLSDSGPQSEPIATNGTIPRHVPVAEVDPTSGPSVDAALSTSPTQAVLQAEPRKPTIGGRKPTGAKKAKGLGAKKGGLGAQKVKANFTELEQEAQARDRNREEEAASVAARAVQQEQDEEKKMASMRLAYKDLSLESKRQEEKMKNMDPKKRAQMERLGMGMMGSGSGGISHSLLNEMKTIEQEAPSNGRNERDRGDRYSSRNRDVDDDFEFIGGFSSGPPKYVDSPFGLKKEDRYSSWSNSSKSSSWDTVDRFDNKSSVIEDIPTAKDDDRGGRSRKAYEPSLTDDAQKKFGNAKGISSDQFFQKDSEFETRQNLSRFEGKSSISSADYFGNGLPGGGSGGSSRYSQGQHGGAGPDLAEIREGVRQGVTKVAGKLSSLANGVMSSIQDNYG